MNRSWEQSDWRAMGLDPQSIKAAYALLENAAAEKLIPGAVAVIGRRSGQGKLQTGLVADTDHRTEEVQTNTIYDCASLTKVMVTLPLTLKLIEQGGLRLDDAVADFIPDFAANGKGHITIRHLLTHTSGLIAFYDMHSHGWTPEEIMSSIYTQHLEYESGSRMVYSDLGFILLGSLCERLLGIPLDEAAKRYVFEPLDMAESCYRPDTSLFPRIAATEFDPAEGAHRVGRVHDENAEALGGVSGHAGLFSTAGDLAKAAAVWLNEGAISPGRRFLSQAAVKAAIAGYTSGITGANRGLGWVLKGDSFDVSGDLMSEAAYGHTGFTGTSIQIDPVYDLYMVLLTNRVHYGRQKSINRLRQCFHNAVVAGIRE